MQRFVIEQAERENHSKDASYHAQGVPDAVAFPKTTEEVQVRAHWILTLDHLGRRY